MKGTWTAGLGVLLLIASSFAQTPPPRTVAHESLACQDCHQEELVDCDHCHDAEINLHPVGIKPSRKIPPEFILNSEGKLLCRSCHQLHGGTFESRFLKIQRKNESRQKFCGRCHNDEEMMQTSPHNARQGTNGCAYCHAALPKTEDKQSMSSKMEIIKICDFCHGALERDHPINVDPGLEFPPGLPLDSEGNWTCATCHDPHGTTSTTHYVRAEYARHFERGREENPHKDDYHACKACHTTSIAEYILPPGYKLRYKGDINILCISCHITGRNHHPTGLPPPLYLREEIEASPLKLPFDKKGQINCRTCHDNGCSTGRQGMRERHYDRSRGKSELCGICHISDSFTKPHVENSRFCPECHEGTPTGKSAAFLASLRFVCLRCHQPPLHPAGTDHMRRPSLKIEINDSLPLDENGEIVCSTCHSSHSGALSFPHRLRAAPFEICSLCHKHF